MILLVLDCLYSIYVGNLYTLNMILLSLQPLYMQIILSVKKYLDRKNSENKKL